MKKGLLQRRDFGQMNVWTDGCMAFVAASLSITFLHRLMGAREGTVIAVLLVGNIIQFLDKRLGTVMDNMLSKENYAI